MKYYIIAGEASGDLHASNLIAEIKKIDSNAHVRCWGGDLMKAQGAELVKHYKDLAFMGFIEVLMNLSTIMKNIRFCKEDINSFKPDVIILVDYPGFNLRIAEFAKHAGYKVVYYISPQIWAWKQSRVHKIKRTVDKMLVILPFEKEFYQRFNFSVDFVGHPLLDAISQINQKDISEIRKDFGFNEKPVISILPGSRKQEIIKMLPEMLKAVKAFPEFQFTVAAVNSHEYDFYQNLCKGYPVKIIFGQTYHLLMISDAAMVTSGTATLETALFEVPEVVCYKGSFISYHLAKKLIKVNYISLVNLIMQKEVVKELIQNDFNSENLISELKKIFIKENILKMKNEFAALREKLGGKGASEKAAQIISQFLQN
ncbi:MAG TPA: lipid-A-disaccharide synthase [Bacteroidales bacterium]|nr:lipid-A-disaccharide synthase [Bacteroidales bacterium]HPS17865.1 lipid-A-disaccharide synthase [Bacteroidales bacterium]